MVFLVEALQTYSVGLCYAVHALSVFHDVRTVLISFYSLFTFLLEINNVAWLYAVFPMALVVLGDGSIRDAHLLADLLERVALASHKIVVVVIYLDGVQTLSWQSFVLACVRGHKLVVACGVVKLVELVEFNYAYKLVGILRICGVATGFQPSCPSLIISLL